MRYNHPMPRLHIRFLLLGALGFFSGLPLALTGATLTAWLADAHVERAAIGLFAAIATPWRRHMLMTSCGTRIDQWIRSMARRP